MAKYATGCLCNASPGQYTPAEKEEILLKEVPREQLYYTQYITEEGTEGLPHTEVNAFYPRTHASVVLYGKTGNSVQDILQKTTDKLEELEKALQSYNKHNIRIADNLVTDSGVISLSARQGKRLKEQLDNFEDISDEVKELTEKWQVQMDEMQEVVDGVEERFEEDEAKIDDIYEKLGVLRIQTDVLLKYMNRYVTINISATVSNHNDSDQSVTAEASYVNHVLSGNYLRVPFNYLPYGDQYWPLEPNFKWKFMDEGEPLIPDYIRVINADGSEVETNLIPWVREVDEYGNYVEQEMPTQVTAIHSWGTTVPQVGDTFTFLLKFGINKDHVTIPFTIELVDE